MGKRERTAQDINSVAEQILGESVVPETAGEQRRRSLVEAAYHLIAERGFEQLRTRDIAARAGVNIATLHYYFARKEDLIQGVVEYLLKQFMTAYLPASSLAMRTPLEQIRGELAEMRYLLQEKPELFIVLNELVMRSLRDPAIHQQMQWLDKGWHAYLEQVLRQGREQHLFRADLEPAHAATWLMLFIKGTTFQFMTSPETVDFDTLQAAIEHWLIG